MQYATGILQHSTARHGTAQTSTAQHSTAQHSTAQHSGVHAATGAQHNMRHRIHHARYFFCVCRVTSADSKPHIPTRVVGQWRRTSSWRMRSRSCARACRHGARTTGTRSHSRVPCRAQSALAFPHTIPQCCAYGLQRWRSCAIQGAGSAVRPSHRPLADSEAYGRRPCVLVVLGERDGESHSLSKHVRAAGGGIANVRADWRSKRKRSTTAIIAPLLHLLECLDCMTDRSCLRASLCTTVRTRDHRAHSAIGCRNTPSVRQHPIRRGRRSPARPQLVPYPRHRAVRLAIAPIRAGTSSSAGPRSAFG